MTETYTHHPLLAKFPMMGSAEKQLLAKSIQKDGLLEDITVHEGHILDGRNREAACQLAGVLPRYREWKGEGGTVTMFIVAKNLWRLHLSESQRAMLAVDLIPEFEADARRRQEAVWAQPGEKIGSKPRIPGNETSGIPGRARDQAGAVVGVSGSSVERAKTVKKKGVPELVDAVETDKIPVKRAAQIAGLSPEEQLKAINAEIAGLEREDVAIQEREHLEFLARKLNQCERREKQLTYPGILADIRQTYLEELGRLMALLPLDDD